jgi:hypothetical protein
MGVSMDSPVVPMLYAYVLSRFVDVADRECRVRLNNDYKLEWTETRKWTFELVWSLF